MIKRGETLERRWAVVHAGRRDQYQVALALQEHGALQQLITDFYTPDVLLRSLDRTSPATADFFRRRRGADISSGLASSSLIQALGPEFARLLHIDPNRSYAKLDALMSRRALRYA